MYRRRMRLLIEVDVQIDMAAYNDEDPTIEVDDVVVDDTLYTIYNTLNGNRYKNFEEFVVAELARDVQCMKISETNAKVVILSDKPNKENENESE